MSVPAKRRPRSEKRKRAAHFALKKVKTTPCPKCKHPKLPHQVCVSCGTYKGREVFKSRLDKKEEKRLKKQKAKTAKKEQNH